MAKAPAGIRLELVEKYENHIDSLIPENAIDFDLNMSSKHFGRLTEDEVEVLQTRYRNVGWDEVWIVADGEEFKIELLVR